MIQVSMIRTKALLSVIVSLVYLLMHKKALHRMMIGIILRSMKRLRSIQKVLLCKAPFRSKNVQVVGQIDVSNFIEKISIISDRSDPLMGHFLFSSFTFRRPPSCVLTLSHVHACYEKDVDLPVRHRDLSDYWYHHDSLVTACLERVNPSSAISGVHIMAYSSVHRAAVTATRPTTTRLGTLAESPPTRITPFVRYIPPPDSG